jgi:hypothetical protein
VTNGPTPIIDRLVVPELVKVLGEIEEEYSVSEVLTKMAMSPYFKPVLAPTILFASVARTAVLYVVPAMDLLGACQSTDAEDLTLPALDLPPLPYKRIAVESIEDQCFPVRDRDSDRLLYEIEAFTIIEEHQGLSWIVSTYLKLGDSTLDLGPGDWVSIVGKEKGDEVAAIAFRLTADGKVTTLTGSDGSWEDYSEHESGGPFEALRRIVIEAVHLITARGVTRTEYPVPRAERRNFTRSQKRYEHPKLYVVKIGGEVRKPSEPGESGRVYRVRWMQQGHWRRFEHRGGKVQLPEGTLHPLIPDKIVLSKTWIGSQIKGPPGAPWKGRPVYHVQEKISA